MLRKLMEEKTKKGMHSEDPEMDSKKKTAMLGVLQHISDMAESAMGDDLSQHISVAAKDREGLKSGLDMAKKIVDKKGVPLHSDAMEESEGEEESPEHEAAESPEMEEEEHEPASEDSPEEESEEDRLRKKY
jgi:cobalamin biosynthesis protein CobT